MMSLLHDEGSPTTGLHLEARSGLCCSSTTPFGPIAALESSPESKCLSSRLQASVVDLLLSLGSTGYEPCYYDIRPLKRRWWPSVLPYHP
jgi:hypothetical protein